ncbi:MAG: YqiA/YcfP family alpha/beta fold hydrolase [Gammaproteobacteria bacterium]
MRTTHLLYLHGFRSSPQSVKARLVAARVKARHPAVTWWCPQLPPSPAAAMALVSGGVRSWPVDRMVVMGSSLGGFYARWLSLRMGCAAVLLNPAVHPARDLARHIGEQTAWHDPAERFFFAPAFVDELQVLEDELRRMSDPAGARPAPRQMAVIARGDEVLDWREMQAFCASGDVRLLPGSDHAISDFSDHIDAVFDFLDLTG